jgi:hypothetical protein
MNVVEVELCGICLRSCPQRSGKVTSIYARTLLASKIFIDGCEVLKVAKQLLGTFVHDTLDQHLQLELSDELDHQGPDISPSE